MSVFRFGRSEFGYGCWMWLGPYVRLNSRKALTPMRPHIYRGHDENCNPTIALHLWPIIGVDVWWKGMKRTDADGICDDCVREYEEAVA